MASSAQGGGEALDATVATGDDAPAVVTPAHVDYLEQVATDADESVAKVERMIADLKDSLAERKATAKRAKADLATARKQMEG